MRDGDESCEGGSWREGEDRVGIGREEVVELYCDDGTRGGEGREGRGGGELFSNQLWAEIESILVRRR